MPRPSAPLLLLACALLAAAGPARAAKPIDRQPGPQPIRVEARPIPRLSDRDDHLGPLTFLGGLVLTSPSPYFGGWSALALDPAATRFVAVSDAGLWLTGRFTERDGRLAGVEDTELGPLLGPNGAPLALSRRGDAESVVFDGGTAYVGLEGVNEVRAFPFGPVDASGAGMLARGRAIRVPPGVKALPGNLGLEALGLAPPGSPVAGALVGVAERSDRRAGPGGVTGGATTRGFLIGGATSDDSKPGSPTGTFEVARHDGYDVSDLAFLPDGDLLLLERRFSFWGGFHMRLRRIAGTTLAPGAVLDGPVLLEAGPAEGIDNMEGLAVSRDASGRTVLTLISDDNYFFLERTLVLRFRLDDGPWPTGREVGRN